MLDKFPQIAQYATTEVESIELFKIIPEIAPPSTATPTYQI
jgi:hypothetical protein